MRKITSFIFKNFIKVTKNFQLENGATMQGVCTAYIHLSASNLETCIFRYKTYGQQPCFSTLYHELLKV